MNKKMLLIGGAAALAVYYFFLRKPAGTTTTTTPKVPTTTNVPVKRETVIVAPSTLTNFEYPYGLKEGDYVKFGTADPVYLLVNGKRRHISYEWMMANDQGYWDKVKFLQSYQALQIPEGPILDV